MENEDIIKDYYYNIDLPNIWFYPDLIKEYAMSQETTKGYLFRAYFNMQEYNHSEFLINIEKAFELADLDNSYCHFICARHYSQYGKNFNPDKVINHGLKALSSNIPNNLKKQVKSVLWYAYEKIENYFEAAKYYIELLEDSSESYRYCKACRNISVQEWLTIYKGNKEKFRTHGSLEVINKLCEQLVKYEVEDEKLKKKIIELEALPNGQEYLRAKEEFENLKVNFIL